MSLKKGDQDHEVSFTSGNGWRVSKKLGTLLAISGALSCLAVGLIVYYVGVAKMTCQNGDALGVVDFVTTTSKTPTTLTTAEDKPTKGNKTEGIRLPGHLIPEMYKIELVPFIIPDNFTIRGKVVINMNCVSPGNNVTLHYADMDLDTNSILLKEVESGRKITIVDHVFDLDREFYVAKLEDNLIAGNAYSIQIEFTAKLADNLKGFYRSVYQDKTSGKDEYIAITQFQPTDARRAFPCMDEPALKARFEVSLGRRKDMSSISNMPIAVDGLGLPMDGTDEYVWDHYEESVPMSTYLVAFVVSKLEYRISPKTDNDVMFRIWARKDAIDQVEYAKELGPRILRFFELYFDVPYPLPKQDMVAVQDFSAGAMENWGLITYRETALLFKPGVSALSNKERVAMVVSHELAHQWFGNLVTPSWWTDLWLNEGFASYVEYLGIEATQPELKLLEQFVLSEIQSVFQIDALESSHPISIEVKHPDEINEIFDRISYAKGASILRMMDNFLTTKTFQRGLTNYLKAFEFKAAGQDDLWHHLTLQAHEDETLPRSVTVKTIMDTWTLQTGFPVVTVDRDYDNNAATISQKRFFVSAKEDDTRWWIPITFVSPGGNFSNTYNSAWMTSDEQKKNIKGLPDKNTPVIFNVQETGYYRVNYDVRNWEMLIERLRTDHESIHVVNRAQIIDDALNLARSGLLSYELALGVTSYLHKETEYVPWSAALDNMGYISKMLRRSGAYGEFKRYMRALVEPLMHRVGFELRDNDQPLDVHLRRTAVSWACSLGIKECVDTVRAQFRKWMDHPDPANENANEIDVDLKSTVYCTSMYNGDEEEWEFGWQRYKGSNVASEKADLLNALSCTKEIWLLNRYLNWSITEDSGVRKADGRSVISRIASNNAGRDLAFDFIRDKWQNILNYYGSTSFALAGLVRNVIKDRNTQFALDELKRFQKDHEDSLSTAKREVEQSIESAEANIKWMNNNYEVIHAWLAKSNSKN